MSTAMRAAKQSKQSKNEKRTSLLPAWLPGWIAFCCGPGRPITVTLLLLAVAVGAWWLIWSQVRGRVLSAADYLVGPQQVEITPAPAWIHSDIRREVFCSATLDGPLSILDDTLNERIANAIALHPWVAKVERVTKHHPARVVVDLVYRRPVCMVAIAGGLYPVDAQGVLLPSGDFTPVEASRYPRLVGIDTVPLGTAGEGWGDPRVVGGAEIAAALTPVWQQWKLLQIAPATPSPPPSFVVFTRGGTRIHWGRALGGDTRGELSAADKVARLQKYVDEHNTLEGPSGPQELDVNGMQTPRVSARSTP